MEKLKSNATENDIISKLNEIITKINEIDERTRGMQVIGGTFKKAERVNPYDISAVAKHITKRSK